MRYISYCFSTLLLLFILSSCGSESTPVYSLTTTPTPDEAGSVSPSSGEYDEGETVEISATPNEDWIFDGWEGDVSGSDNPATVTMDSDKDVAATFVLRDYPLTVEIEGEGTVQEMIAKKKTTDYGAGTFVELTAKPADGWIFSHWEGDLSNSENPSIIEINDEKYVTAIFEIDFSDWRAFFEYVPEAFPDLDYYYSQVKGSAFSTTLSRADLNLNGVDDLIIHLMHFREEHTMSMSYDAPVPNRMITLTSDGEGKFSDATDELLGSRNVDLAGGASRKIRIEDLNNNGYPDWVYALNREDRRPCGDCNDDQNYWANESVAVLSDGNGGFDTHTFGDAFYNHSVEIINLGNQNYDILLTDKAYSFNGNSFTLAEGYPDRSYGTSLAIPSLNSSKTEYLLIDKSANSYGVPNYLSLTRNESTSWKERATFKFDDYRIVDFVEGDGQLSKKSVIKYRGQEFMEGGFYESTYIQLYPDSEPIPIIHYATSYIPAGSGGRDTLYQSEALPWSKLMALEKAGDELIETNIISDPEGPYNINFLDVIDINGNGYQDFVTYPYRDGGLPRIYLNNQNGFLELLPSNMLPQVNVDSRWTAHFADVTGNNLKDLILFPGNGCSVNETCTKYKLFKAKRPLELP